MDHSQAEVLRVTRISRFANKIDLVFIQGAISVGVAVRARVLAAARPAGGPSALPAELATCLMLTGLDRSSR
jgi:hypothetical protein